MPFLRLDIRQTALSPCKRPTVNVGIQAAPKLVSVGYRTPSSVHRPPHHASAGKALPLATFRFSRQESGLGWDSRGKFRRSLTSFSKVGRVARYNRRGHRPDLNMRRRGGTAMDNNHQNGELRAKRRRPAAYRSGQFITTGSESESLPSLSLLSWPAPSASPAKRSPIVRTRTGRNRRSRSGGENAVDEIGSCTLTRWSTLR